MMSRKNSSTLISFPNFLDENGELCVYESPVYVPFVIKRVFTIRAPLDSVRGQHAHKKCSQLLISLTGKILITCDDGANKTEYLLAGMNSGLLIPPGIWAEQKYLDENSLLMVLCSHPFDEADYLRDYKIFKEFISSKS
jgi:dTDP-4-dehydrorhamnose 3,5-epimerase-like enzyme